MHFFLSGYLIELMRCNVSQYDFAEFVLHLKLTFPPIYHRSYTTGILEQMKVKDVKFYSMDLQNQSQVIPLDFLV